MKIEDIKYEFPEMPEEMRAMIKSKISEQLNSSEIVDDRKTEDRKTEDRKTEDRKTADRIEEGSCNDSKRSSSSAVVSMDQRSACRNGNRRPGRRKRTALLILAATFALGTTAFAGVNLYQMYTERVGTYGMKTVAEIDSSKIDSEAMETDLQAAADVKGEIQNVTIKASYLPEGMEEAPWGFDWYYGDAPRVGGFSSCLFELDPDDSFEIVDKDILTSESIEVNGHSGVYLTRRVDDLAENQYDKIIYVMYPEAQVVLQLYVGENVSREEAIRFAEGIELAETAAGEEGPKKVAWKEYVRSVTEPETEIYEAKVNADREELGNTHGVGEEFALESFAEKEKEAAGVTEDITAKVASVQIADDLSLLDPEYLDASLKMQTDEQGKLLPNEMEYIKMGDGIDSTDEILKTETVAQKLVYVSVDYKNTGDTPLYNILFYANLLKIEETADGFAIFNREAARGGEACNKLSCSGGAYLGEMQYWDRKSSAGHNGSNYIDVLQPGETVTVHMGFLVNEDELGYLYLDLSGTGGAYEFSESSLKNGYVDIRQ